MEDAPRHGSQPRSELAEGYVLDQGREALGTTSLDARPDIILKMPEDSYVPFLLGLFAALLFVGMLLRSWLFTALWLAACAVLIVVWLWPERQLVQCEPETVTDVGN